MLLGGGAAFALEGSTDSLQMADFDHFVFLLLSIVLYRLASMGVLNILVNRLRGLR